MEITYTVSVTYNDCKKEKNGSRRQGATKRINIGKLKKVFITNFTPPLFFFLQFAHGLDLLNPYHIVLRSIFLRIFLLNKYLLRYLISIEFLLCASNCSRVWWDQARTHTYIPTYLHTYKLTELRCSFVQPSFSK